MPKPLVILGSLLLALLASPVVVQAQNTTIHACGHLTSGRLRVVAVP